MDTQTERLVCPECSHETETAATVSQPETATVRCDHCHLTYLLGVGRERAGRERAGAGPGASAAPRGDDTSAVTGFVVSLLGLMMCQILAPFGYSQSLTALRKNPKSGLAIAGVVIGAIGTLLLLAAIVVVLLAMTAEHPEHATAGVVTVATSAVLLIGAVIFPLLRHWADFPSFIKAGAGIMAVGMALLVAGALVAALLI